jgi:phosphotransferase system HPr (HPr) family protein
MHEVTLRVKNNLGLHARAAARLVRLASTFESIIMLRRTDSEASADARSILSVLQLAAAYGVEVTISATGADEEQAIAEVEQMFLDGFGEM